MQRERTRFALAAEANMSCIPSSALRTSITDYGAQAVVDARTGVAFRLDSLWSSSPCVILFLRRLGCALCRTTALEYSDRRSDIEATGASLIAVSFEQLGTGSDSDGSFTAGQFWPGPLYTISKDMYEHLFGRKGLFSGFFGIADVSRSKLSQCTDRSVKGNLKGDGLLLGGQFVIGAGGVVLRDHRQRFFGDDLTVEDILEALQSPSPPAATPAAPAPAAPSTSLHSLPFGVAKTTGPNGEALPDGAFWVPAADRNKEPIGAALRELCGRVGGSARILEVAAGSGQHAEAIAPGLSKDGLLASWLQTDGDARGVASCNARRTAIDVIKPARELNVNQWPDDFRSAAFDIVIAVNLLHIAPVETTRQLVEGAAAALREKGLLVVYGPFLIDGRPTTESNAKFDETMKSLGFGLRDVQDVNAVAMVNGFAGVEQRDMPANNFLLVFEKK